MVRRLTNREAEELELLPVQERLADPELCLDRFFEMRAFRIAFDQHAIRGRRFHEIAVLLLQDGKTPRGTGGERVSRMLPHHCAVSLDRGFPVTGVLSGFALLK